jgi:hypothetical protein
MERALRGISEDDRRALDRIGSEMDGLHRQDRWEVSHAKADELLLEALEILGQDRIVRGFNAAGMRYA